jgi:crossover junction endodeoxyribonuclease RuvC
MVVLGIDPGLAIVGYGVVECGDNMKLRLIDFGTILTEAGEEFPRRLLQISQGMERLIDMYAPDSVAFEELFFNKNVKTAIIVAQARGAAVAAARKKTAELYEYTPLQVKQAVTGYGRADKNQVQMMVKTLLKLSEIPRPDDAADAVAVAVCHAHSARTAGILDTRMR